MHKEVQSLMSLELSSLHLVLLVRVKMCSQKVELPEDVCVPPTEPCEAAGTIPFRPEHRPIGARLAIESRELPPILVQADPRCWITDMHFWRRKLTVQLSWVVLTSFSVGA